MVPKGERMSRDSAATKRFRVAILLGHSRREPLPEAAEMATAAVADLRLAGLAIEVTIDQATRDALDRVEARGGCDLLLFYGHGETDGSLQWADGKMWFDDLAGTPSRKSFWERLDGVIVFACHGASFAVQRLTERGLAGWRRRLVLLAVVLCLVGAVYFIFKS